MAETVVEARAPRRARAILNNLIASRAMTPSGLKWLEIATDPFHDTEIRADGYPDMVSTRSITQTVTKTITVNVPTGVSTNWDLHVWFAPLTPTFVQNIAMTPPPEPANPEPKGTEKKQTSNSSRKRPREPSETEDTDTDPEQVGDGALTTSQGYCFSTVSSRGQLTRLSGRTTVWPGWNAIGVTGGGNWSTGIAEAHSDVSLPRDYSSGAWRLIATGLEVTNTTAQLYKGGSVTAYRSPSPSTMGNYWGGTGSTDLTGSYRVCAKTAVTPPFSQSDAALYPNSRTWAAEDGCYLIATMNSTDNPYFVPKPGMGGLIIPRSTADLEDGSGWTGYFPVWLTTDGTGFTDPNSASCTTLPYDITGAVFTGLNPNSSMQVTVRYYIERNPTVADPNLLVLARTPCPYDPTALEIYTRCMEHLPVGVKVDMNPLGEWFTEVLQGIGEWAPKIGKAVGNIIPGGAIIGNILGTAANGIQGVRGAKKVTETITPKKTTVVVQKTKKQKPNYGRTPVYSGPIRSGEIRRAPPRKKRKKRRN